MIHYHGGPITPQTCAIRAWSGRHAFISWANPEQIEVAAGVCQSFALDNGAFSLWGKSVDVDWLEYYRWAEEWLSHPACDWAIIPDVIGGTEDQNDALIDEWPHGNRGVPVWHTDESPERLVELASRWPRVALGSAAQYDVSRVARCLDRLAEVLPLISKDGRPVCKLHGLRMLRHEITNAVPLSSADSTNIARNIGMDGRWTGAYQPTTKEGRVDVLVQRIESVHTPGHLVSRDIQQEALFA
jgi:hypothetical protein